MGGRQQRAQLTPALRDGRRARGQALLEQRAQLVVRIRLRGSRGSSAAALAAVCGAHASS